MNAVDNFQNRMESFIKAADKNHVKMIMVGGGAVNFHGYQRHSADIDFWIDITTVNLKNILQTLIDLGYNLNDLPDKVKTGQQNISIKISPVFEIELITSFNPGCSFKEAYEQSIAVDKGGLKYNVLSLDHLIQSKITSERLKDKLDVEMLQKIQLKRKE